MSKLLALILIVFGCTRGSDPKSADKGGAADKPPTTSVDPPATSPPPPPAASPAAPSAASSPSSVTPAPTAPPASGNKGAMSKAVAMKGMSSVEHGEPGGKFTPVMPEGPAPPKVKEGDRLRVRLEVADDTWVYAIAAVRQADYAKLGVWEPGKNAKSGVRTLWPGGRVLSAADASMSNLFVIASSEELPWARDLTRTNCSSLVGKPPPNPPATPCDHLYGLYWKIAARPRGMVAPKVDFFDDGGTRFPAIVDENSGTPYAVLEWQFKPRK